MYSAKLHELQGEKKPITCRDTVSSCPFPNTDLEMNSLLEVVSRMLPEAEGTHDDHLKTTNSTIICASLPLVQITAHHFVLAS